MLSVAEPGQPPAHWATTRLPHRTSVKLDPLWGAPRTTLVLWVNASTIVLAFNHKTSVPVRKASELQVSKRTAGCSGREGKLNLHPVNKHHGSAAATCPTESRRTRVACFVPPHGISASRTSHLEALAVSAWRDRRTQRRHRDLTRPERLS